MEAVTVALGVIIPIYLMIAVGYVAKRFGIFSQATLREMNTSVFRLFLPLLLFENMYSSRMNVVDTSVLIYAVISVFVIFILCCVVMLRMEKEKTKAATMIQGMYRSNFALLGIALTETLYGADGTEITGMLVALIIPLYNVLAVILFETVCQNKRANVGGIIAGILKNPLIIGTCAGLILNIFRFEIPAAINSAVVSLGQVATPLALVVMGGSFEAKKTIKNKKALAVVSTVRLIAIPLLCTMIAVAVGYREKSLYALFLMYATPTAIASYAMASVMGGDEDLAGEIVLITTVLSMVTLGVGVYVLTLFRLI